MSSRFIYSCKAFRRASISAMSAAWWLELYSVRVGGGAGAVRAQYAALGLWGRGRGDVESQAHLL